MKIETLLLSGANNHDWKRTSPYLRDVLESSERFAVTLTENPSQTLEGDLSRYALFFSDYNGSPWSNKAQSNFVQAIENGAGLCVLHAADNAFPGWAAWEQMCGLCFQDGSNHGDFHTFRVLETRDHPITRGLTPFETTDELYHGMKNPQGAAFEVLATAHSSLESRGTGQSEPVLLTTQYGRGRVFHSLLGHIWPRDVQGDPNGDYKGASLVALEGAGFQRTLLRGCEWAATGEVTL